MKHRHLHPSEQRKKTIRYLIAVVLSVLGVFCFVMANTIRTYLPFLLSVILFILAGDRLFEALSDRHYDEEDTDEIASAIVFIIVGIVTLFEWKHADILIGAVWGMIGLFMASRNISHSLLELIHKKGRTVGHILHLAHALLSIGISILLLLDPVEHLLFHVYILGLELLDSAVRTAFEEE